MNLSTTFIFPVVLTLIFVVILVVLGKQQGNYDYNSPLLRLIAGFLYLFILLAYLALVLWYY